MDEDIASGPFTPHWVDGILINAIWQQHTKCAINILKYSCAACGKDLFEAPLLAKWRLCLSTKESPSLLTFFPELCLWQTRRPCWKPRVHMAAVCCPVAWQPSWQQVNNLSCSLSPLNWIARSSYVMDVRMSPNPVLWSVIPQLNWKSRLQPESEGESISSQIKGRPFVVHCNKA